MNTMAPENDSNSTQNSPKIPSYNPSDRIPGITSIISCDMLKANKISENGHDNYKRKEMILKVLQTEDLLTMITNMRPPPTC